MHDWSLVAMLQKKSSIYLTETYLNRTHCVLLYLFGSHTVFAPYL